MLFIPVFFRFFSVRTLQVCTSKTASTTEKIAISRHQEKNLNRLLESVRMGKNVLNILLNFEDRFMN